MGRGTASPPSPDMPVAPCGASRPDTSATTPRRSPAGGVRVPVRFAAGTAAMQFEERATWVPSSSIGYHLGVDGIALPLVLLTALMLPLGLLSPCGSASQGREQF